MQRKTHNMRTKPSAHATRHHLRTIRNTKPLTWLPAASETKMASSSAGNGKEQKSGRKRKRNSDIPGFAPLTSSTPGVTSQAPRAINAELFAASRALEIKNMVRAITEADKISGGKRVFQTLPRHMRRRAMSHNVKRVPVRVRQRAAFEVCMKVYERFLGR